MIRVLLADDHEIVRLGLRAVLESADDIEVIGEVATAEAAIAAAQAGGIDVILMHRRRRHRGNQTHHGETAACVGRHQL